MEAKSTVAPPGVAPKFRTPASDINDPNPLLECIPYIYYSLCFQKDIANVRVLIDFDNKINTITLAYILKLGSKVRYTNIRVQKIDGSTHQTFKIIRASF